MEEDQQPGGYAPLSKDAILAQLRYLFRKLATVQQQLAQARDTEVAAKHAYLSARRSIILSGQVPKVSRGGYTTADRDAFVDNAVEDLELQYRIAEAAREAAQDLLRITRDQAEIVRSLGAAMRQELEMAGNDY